MLGRNLRHVSRYREIASVLAKHGLGFIIKDLGLIKILSLPDQLFRHEKPLDSQSVGERIRRVLEELGPAFIKLGQIASTRPDILPENIIAELEKLQDRVGSFPFAKVEEIFLSENKVPLHKVFARFNEEPLAAASIGQVHQAVLHSGEVVAVKIQRPQITRIIETDLEILLNLAEIAEQKLEWARFYCIKDVFKEFADSLLAELDYSLEGHHAERIAKQFTDQPLIRIPKVFWEYSTKKVLIMEYVDGIKINEHQRLKESGHDLKEVAHCIIEAIFHQIFIEGFFHGDPHPGNILVLPNGSIAFIDFGMVGRLSPEMKTNVASLVIAMIRKNPEHILKTILNTGVAPEDVRISLLREDINGLKEKYLDLPISQISLGTAIKEMFTITFKHRIRIPADLTLLGKVLLTLEGIIEMLDPELSIINIAQPFGTKLLKERYQMKTVTDKLAGAVLEYGDLLLEFPKLTKELLASLRHEHREVKIPQAEMFFKKVDRIGNLLAFSLILLSLSLLLTGLILASALGGQLRFLANIPLLEIGFVLFFLMFGALLTSIFRSGRF